MNDLGGKSKDRGSTEEHRGFPAMAVVSIVFAVILLIDLGLLGASQRASDNMCAGCHGNRFKEYCNLLPGDPSSVLPTEFTENFTEISMAVELISNGDPGHQSYFEVSSLKVTLTAAEGKLNISEPQKERTGLFPDAKVIYNWTVNGILPGQDTLTFSLYGVNPHENSVAIDSYSYDVSVTLPYEKPSAPRNFRARAGDDYVYLSWEGPEDDGGKPVTEYGIYRGDLPGGVVYLDSVEGTTTAYNDTSVNNGVTYYYQITAVNDIGESGSGARISATPRGPPSPPRDLRATGGNGFVRLDWEPPAEDGGTPILRYDIHRGNTSGITTFLVSAPVNETSHNDTGVENGRSYYYVVTAVNDIGGSGPGIEVSATPQRDVTSPSPPRDLASAAGNGFAYIYWKRPDDDGGAVIMGYKIYRGVNSGDPALLDSVLGFTTDYNDTSVRNGHVYRYHVTAVNPAGESDPSNNHTARPRGAPEPPGNLRSEIGRGYVELSWEAPESDGGSAVVSYRIYRGRGEDDPAELSEVSGGIRSYNDTSITNGVPYYYHVIALNSLGESLPGDVAKVISRWSPAPPRNLTGVRGPGYIELFWEPPADDGGYPVRSYNIHRGVFSGAETYRSTVNYTMTRYRDLDPNIFHYNDLFYYVTAVNVVGESAPGNEINVTIWEPVNNTNDTARPAITSFYPGDEEVLVDLNEVAVFYVGTVGNVSTEWYLDDELYARGTTTLTYPVTRRGTHEIRARITDNSTDLREEITWRISTDRGEEGAGSGERSDAPAIPGWTRSLILYGGLVVLAVLAVYLTFFYGKTSQ